jgi:uncharacterized protein (TIGR02145 family)
MKQHFYFKKVPGVYLWVATWTLFILCSILLCNSCQKEDEQQVKSSNLLKSATSMDNDGYTTYFQNELFVRETGKPVVVKRQIGNAKMSDYEPYFKLHVRNGFNGKNFVSSATVKIDGNVILKSSDFKNRDQSFVFDLCNLTETSVMEVEILGKPGSTLEIWIDGKLTNSGTFMDARDGNVYKWVKIGNQIWMAENLRATNLNDGTPLHEITDNTLWENNTTGAYCWYDNDITSYENPYGALYNWYAVYTGKLSPTGWHVPTDDDWKQLEIYLGMSQEQADEVWLRGTVEGGKLKDIGTEHWNDPNIGATNETGFSALGGGYRISSGTFVDMKNTGHWWSSTVFDPSNAWYRYIRADNSTIGRLGNSNHLGFSVRCVKD